MSDPINSHLGTGNVRVDLVPGIKTGPVPVSVPRDDGEGSRGID